MTKCWIRLVYFHHSKLVKPQELIFNWIAGGGLASGSWFTRRKFHISQNHSSGSLSTQHRCTCQRRGWLHSLISLPCSVNGL